MKKFQEKNSRRRHILRGTFIDLSIDKTPGAEIWLLLACVNAPERKENYINYGR
ncbi:MAG: hypothetical protein Q4E89_13375 [Eubacteriales bacterium]|nr:hypothetical protein [Eubacteriales bacterium]